MIGEPAERRSRQIRRLGVDWDMLKCENMWEMVNAGGSKVKSLPLGIPEADQT